MRNLRNLLLNYLFVVVVPSVKRLIKCGAFAKYIIEVIRKIVIPFGT